MKKFFGALSGVFLLLAGLPSSLVSTLQASSYVPTFTNQTGNFTSSDAYGVAYGAGTWVKVMYATPYYSTDGGSSWAAATTPVTSGLFQNIEYLNGRFFALCESSCTVGKQIQYSDDGINWSAASVPTTNVPFADAGWSDVAYGDGALVAIGSGMLSGNETANRVLRSTDNGATWSIHQLPQVLQFPVKYAAGNSIVYSNGQFVVVGTDTMTSTDGITWSIRNSTDLLDVAAGNGVLLAVSFIGNGSNHLYKSTNGGASWSAVSHPSLGISPEYTFRIRFGNGVFLFGATKFVTTADGSTFSAATNWLSTGSGQWRGLGFGAGRFVAVGDTSNGGASKTIASSDTPDTTAPTISTYSPIQGGTGSDPGANIVLGFSESVVAGLGGRKITIKRTSDNSTVQTMNSDSSSVTYSGSTVTINPSGDLPPLSQLYVLIEAGAITDLAGNAFAGISTTTGYEFTTGADVTAPLAPYTPDLASSTDSGTSSTDNITNNPSPLFSVRTREAAGTVTVTATRTAASPQTCSMAGSTSGSTCSLSSLGEGTWNVVATHADAAGNISGASTALTVVIDRTGPSISTTSPAANSTNVAVGSDVIVTFSESVLAGTGSFVLYKGSTCATSVETFVVSSSMISGATVTIDPASDLDYSTRHCLTYPSGILKDAAGNDVPAMTLVSNGNVEFTTSSSDQTPPTLTVTSPASPSSSRTLVYSLTFSEPVLGLTSGDFTNSGTATCTFAVPSATATTFSVTATCTTDGTVVLRVGANSVVDAAQNTGPTAAVTASSVTINSSTTTTVAPSNSVAPTASTPTATTVPNTGGTPGATTATTAPPTTTTTVPPASTTTTTLPELVVPEVADDGGALVIDGERIEATVTRENNQLILQAGVIRARISAVKREGGRAPLDSEGRIRMATGDSIAVEVTGFGPSSPVEVRMYSDPVLLGRSNVDALGALAASYEVPESVDNGRHTVVLIGESAANEELTFALAVYVGGESSGPSALALLVGIPLGLAVIGALIIPAILRRRRDDAAGI